MDMDFRLDRSKSDQQKKRNEDVYGKWSEIGSNNQAGRTLVAEFDTVENSLYVASDGGQIWKVGMDEENWTSLTDHLRIPAIHFLRNLHLRDMDRLLVGSGMWGNPGVMYSDDEGMTWEQATGLENIVSWGYIRRTVMSENPENGIYLLAQEWDSDLWMAVSKIYVSYDNGESFTDLVAFPYGANNVDIWTDRYANSTVYILDRTNLYAFDENDELQALGTVESEDPESVYLTGAVIDGLADLYCMFRISGQSNLHYSGDGGLSWAEQGSNGSGPFMINSFKASPTMAGTLYFGGVNAFTSSDFGANWDLINEWWEYYDSPEDMLHADIPSFDSFIDEEGNEMLFISTDGGTYVSFDYAENVQNISLHNLNISQYYSNYTNRMDSRYTHAGSQDQGYQFSNMTPGEQAIDFDQLISGDYASIVSGDSGASVWMVYPGFVMRRPDAVSGSNLNFWDFVGSNYQWLPQLMEDPNDPNSVYVAGGRLTTGARLIHLTRNGNTWDYEESEFDFSNGTEATISSLDYSSIDNNYRYVFTTERDFFFSTDGGENWTESDVFEGPGTHYFYGNAIQASHNTLGLVYLAGSGYSDPPAFVSTDNGKTFIPMSDGLPHTLVFDLALSSDDSLLFAATEVGAFVCKTWEQKWYDLADSLLPDQTFWSVDYVPALQSARFSTYGRGIWEFNTNPAVIAAFSSDTMVVEEGGTIQFFDESQWNPNSWTWYFEGGAPVSSNLQNPEVIYPNSGFYSVTLVASNESSMDSVTVENYIEVVEVTSIPEKDEMVLELYPNPATNQITINNIEKAANVRVYDLNGKLIFTRDFSAPTASLTIDLTKYPTGSYIMRVENESGIVSKRFVKK